MSPQSNVRTPPYPCYFETSKNTLCFGGVSRENLILKELEEGVDKLDLHLAEFSNDNIVYVFDREH